MGTTWWHSVRDYHAFAGKSAWLTFFAVVMTTVVSSLTPIRTDGTKLWKLLFQLSFSNDSPASLAVLRAMLSVASLYRYGHGEEPLRLKTSALESLSTSMNGHITGTTEIYQHAAVGMLLCAFEVSFSPTLLETLLIRLDLSTIRELFSMAVICFGS